MLLLWRVHCNTWPFGCSTIKIEKRGMSMKKIVFALASLVVVSLLSACSSSAGPDPRASTGRTVTRIDSRTQTDLSGYWNDTDVRLIAETLVTECVNAPSIINFIKENRRVPVVIIGTFKNQSDEHIDTSILAKKFEVALVNSGKVDFVASKTEREEIRSEREAMQEWSSEETVKALANESAADFMLIGYVKTIVDAGGGDLVRTYIVNAELVDIEKNRKVWVGENSEIKKYITRASSRW